jgi:hypothetical protein
MPRQSADASRAAVREFLRNQIGLGGTFTSQDLRRAIPNVSQVDRRMRELRQAQPVPWLIASSQSDRALAQDTYRVDRIGSDTVPTGPSGRVRREVFESAGNRCQVCGIGVGEEYAEYPGEVARLQLGHWVPLDQGGSLTARGNLRAECHRCNGGIRNRTGAVVTAASITVRVGALPRRDRVQLLGWLDQNQRDVSDGERLFYEARQLPPAEQREVIEALRRLVRGGDQP